MKKACSLLLTICLLIGLLGTLPVAAAGSLAASASATSVTIGNSVTITLKYSGGGAPIASIDAQVSYNADAFKYTSCAGASANGGAGVVKVSYYPTDATAPKTVTITLTFRATGAGDGKFAVSTNEFMDDDTFASLGTPSKSLTVSAINPTKSANANLASLKPSSGTLTPAFSAKTTEYTISVPYGTSSLNLSATPADSGAKTAISGSNALQVGKNTRVITVTAANGTTKKYTVIITRAAMATTQAPTNPVTTTPVTTTTTPPAPQLEVSVDGVLMNVLDTQPEEALPAGFQWDFITLKEQQVSAAKNEKTGMVLLYLESTVDGKKAFYIYDEESGEFATFRPFRVKGGNYVLLDMPAEQDAPTGTAAGTLEYEGGSVSAFMYHDEALTDYAIVYATSLEGNTGLYVYDRTDGSLQRYHEVPQPEPMPVEPEPEVPANAFVAFVTDYREVLLIGAAVLGGVALLIGAIALLVTVIRRGKRAKCKH